jgi:hypothetical protein
MGVSLLDSAALAVHLAALLKSGADNTKRLLVE